MIIRLVGEALVVLPALERDERVELFPRRASPQVEIVAFPGDMTGVEQVNDGRILQSAVRETV